MALFVAIKNSDVASYIKRFIPDDLNFPNDKEDNVLIEGK